MALSLQVEDSIKEVKESINSVTTEIDNITEWTTSIQRDLTVHRQQMNVSSEGYHEINLSAKSLEKEADQLSEII